jgi:hypothetical protein
VTGAQCNTCKHYEGEARCPFFDGNIPARIMSGAEPHPEYRHYENGKKWDELTDEERF